MSYNVLEFLHKVEVVTWCSVRIKWLFLVDQKISSWTAQTPPGKVVFALVSWAEMKSPHHLPFTATLSFYTHRQHYGRVSKKNTKRERERALKVQTSILNSTLRVLKYVWGKTQIFNWGHVQTGKTTQNSSFWVNWNKPFLTAVNSCIIKKTFLGFYSVVASRNRTDVRFFPTAVFLLSVHV